MHDKENMHGLKIAQAFYFLVCSIGDGNKEMRTERRET